MQTEEVAKLNSMTDVQMKALNAEKLLSFLRLLDPAVGTTVPTADKH